MKKSIYLTFSYVPPALRHDGYISVCFGDVHCALFEMASIHFVGEFLTDSDLMDCYEITLYIPHRGNGFTLHASNMVNGKKQIFPLDNDFLFKYAEKSIYAGSFPYDSHIPSIVRLIMNLMSDNQLKVAFPKLYGLYHNIKL